MEEWLSEEEQYAEILNDKDISKIKDPELRKIREKHWKYRTDIFLDKHNITDEQLVELTHVDCKREKEEIERYKNSRNL